MTFSGQQINMLDIEIENQPFFPVLVLSEFVTAYAIPVKETAIVRHHLMYLMYAMVQINGYLEAWHLEQVNSGYATLEAVPAEIIGGHTLLVHLYLRAVYYQAKATLSRDYPSIDRREAAEHQAKSAEETEALYERWSQAALNQIMGRSNVKVALI